MRHPLEPRLARYTSPPECLAPQRSRSRRWSAFPAAHRGKPIRFRLAWHEDGEPHERRLILRRDPPASLIDTERRVEFAAYGAFHGSAVPVPQMLWLEEADGPLDHPFFIAEELSGFPDRATGAVRRRP